MALAQLQYPQEAIHGWSGLAVNPVAYQLLTGNVFIIPPDPGPTAVYPAWAAPNNARTIDVKFLRSKNYYFLYKNIQLHARRNGIGPIQGVEQSQPHRLERYHVRPGHFESASKFLW